MKLFGRIIGLSTYDGYNCIETSYEPDGDTVSTLKICVGDQSLAQFYLGQEITLTIEAK